MAGRTAKAPFRSLHFALSLAVVCGICGGKRIREDVYTAREDDGPRLVGVPGLRCDTCGALLPDVSKIESMPELRIPSSVRMRCVKIKPGE
jgi:hypothetical protein